MTEEKLCPFTLGKVVPSYCCKEKCMAWNEMWQHCNIIEGVQNGNYNF